jgi:[NiFe] hydrogenase diaphorase moiety large subunit
MIAPCGFDRTICYDDLATGGSLMVFNESRDVLEVVHAFMEFFEDESCGYCAPCRVGNVLIKQLLDRILQGKGEPADLAQIEDIGKAMKTTSRCGLGQTSALPALTSLANFRELYESRVQEGEKGRRRSFDLEAATSEAQRIRAGGSHE